MIVGYEKWQSLKIEWANQPRNQSNYVGANIFEVPTNGLT